MQMKIEILSTSGTPADLIESLEFLAKEIGIETPTLVSFTASGKNLYDCVIEGTTNDIEQLIDFTEGAILI